MRAVAFDPDGNGVPEFVWTPGLGGGSMLTAGTSDFTTAYAPGSGIAIVAVTAHDTRGGTATIERDLNVPQCVAAETHDCGCTNMNLYSKDSSNSFVLCADGAVPRADLGCVAEPNPPADEACGKGQTAFRCPLGPRTPANTASFRWSFEISAFLSDNTNDITKCEEGQFANLTVVQNNGKVPNPDTQPAPAIPAGGVLTLPGGTGGATTDFRPVGGGTPPAKYPAFGSSVGGKPQLGADDYAAPWEFKRHLPDAKRFRWFDSPGGAPVKAADTFSFKGRFLAYVKGNKGACWCYFEIDHSWGATGRTGGATVTFLDGNTCNVVQ